MCKVHLRKLAPHPSISVLPEYHHRNVVGTMPRSLEMFPNLSIASQPGISEMLLCTCSKGPIGLANIHPPCRITAKQADDGIHHISRLASEATTDRKVAFRSSDDGCRRDMPAYLASGKATRVSPRRGIISRRTEEAGMNQKIPKAGIP